MGAGLEAFHFLRPWWLLLLPVVAVLCWQLWRWRGSAASPWRAVCDAALLERLLVRDALSRPQRWPWLLGAALSLAVMALAGPAWERMPQPLYRQQQALVLLLDLSRSMLAGDLRPDRLTRARQKLEDLLTRRHEGQTALVVYAAEPFVLVPLTDDARVIAQQLSVLTPEMMPAQGSRLDLALKQASELLRESGVVHGQVLVLTDGVDDSAVAEAKRLYHRGHRVSVLAFGSEEGAPIPGSGGFVTDRSGNIVVARSDMVAMRRLASAGGGAFAQATLDDSDLSRVLFRPVLRQGEGAQARDAGRAALGDRWREEGPWLLLPLLLLAAFAFRRGWLLAGVVVVVMLPAPARAWSLADLWRNADQQGMALLEQGNSRQAAERFADWRWQAVARYRAGDYTGALHALRRPRSADDWYNRGNALAKAGQLGEAIAAYDQALKLQPDMEDAAFNRDLLRRLQAQKRKQGQGRQGNERAQREKKGANAGAESGARKQQSADGGTGRDRRRGSDAGKGRVQAKNDQGEEGSSASLSSADRGASSGERNRRAREEAAREDRDAQKKPERFARMKRAAGDRSGKGTPSDDSRMRRLKEQQQARAMWLRRVPDDPGGLLRRKFQYQYRQRGREQQGVAPW